MKNVLLIAAITLIGLTLRASAVTFASGDQQVSLLELYTSEGCSSCPLAEAWLSSLVHDSGLWKSFVPVAFHVDYWNSLGWPDRFSSPAFTQRQQDYATLWRADQVYTPEFVLDGREWHYGPKPARSTASPGDLRVTIEDRTHVAVSFRPMNAPTAPLSVKVAPLANGVITNVRGGENSGRHLLHDFVVLSLLEAELKPTTDGRYEVHFTLPEKTTAPVAGLAAWVSAGKDPTPLQATGGPVR